MTPLLAITSEPMLADTLQRLAAVAGLDCDVLPPARCTPAAWVRPPLVVVGTDAIDDLAAPLPSRTGVIVASPEGETATTWEGALAIGARNVIALPQGESWLVEQMLAVADAGPSGSVVAVVGASGGVGASLIAVALARAAKDCVLIDADARGGGLDLVLGCEDEPGSRWADLAHARGRLASSALMAALPHNGYVALLSHGVDAVSVAPEALASVVAAARSACALVVIDLPRHLLDASLLEQVDACVLVVADRIRAIAAAKGALSLLRAHRTTTHVVARAQRRPGGVDIDDLQRTLGVKAVVTVEDDAGVARAVENGDPWPRRGSIAKAAQVLASVLQ